MNIKTILTKYPNYCLICGVPAEAHHIFKGNKQRKLSDEDLLIMPLCPEHHRGNMSVHNKKEMNVLCEIAGQLAFERVFLAKKLANVNKDGLDEQTVDEWLEEAREAFRKRYSRSYL